ncbi:DUF1343 domain-containing protein [Polaribacter sp.]|nr:DUF1343 domain-containing protein [Polaribacter sp.]
MRFLTQLKNTYLCWFVAFVFCGISCAQKTDDNQPKKIKTGADQTELYLKFLQHKKVGVVANQTSVIKSKENSNNIHLVDSLLALHIDVKKVFAPEHGFRGKADAGELVKNGKDSKTGLPIISLYGKNKKPTTQQLQNLDVIIFDIQDVGARFYTYISTLHYVMEACAEQNISVIVLDRPNPNGHYIDGPVLQEKNKSFVGMHKVPVVYGMTIGEYAKMINGESWLQNNIKCNLTVIPIDNYTHNTNYDLPIKPSPNLPNATSINLYPILCFFEGTTVSVGRGTTMQFQIFGHPDFDPKQFNFSFTPKPNEGAKYPKHENKVCYGKDLRTANQLNTIDLEWLIIAYKAYKKSKSTTPFFNSFFTKLAGTEKLQQQIENGLSTEEIKESWKDDINTFKKIRQQYLIYE